MPVYNSAGRFFTVQVKLGLSNEARVRLNVAETWFFMSPFNWAKSSRTLHFLANLTVSNCENNPARRKVSEEKSSLVLLRPYPFLLLS